MNFIEALAPEALESPKVGGNGDLISNANGAPRIGVAHDFSAEGMAVALMGLLGKTQENQMAMNKGEISAKTKKAQDQNQQNVDKISQWDKKCQSAEAKAKIGGILGWLKKVSLVVVAAFSVAMATIATVATGGAATPLLALALLGLASAVTGLASDISKATGHKGFDHVMQWMDPGTLVGKGMAELAKKLGADESQAAKVAIAFSIATTVGIMIASVVLSGGATMGSVVENFAKTLSNTMKTVVTLTASMSKIAQPVASVVGGLTDMAQGGINIAVANDKRAASNIQADIQSGDSFMVKLQQQMEDARKDLKKALDELMDGISLVSQMINAASQSRAQISKNLLGRSMSV